MRGKKYKKEVWKEKLREIFEILSFFLSIDHLSE